MTPWRQHAALQMFSVTRVIARLRVRLKSRRGIPADRLWPLTPTRVGRWTDARFTGLSIAWEQEMFLPFGMCRERPVMTNIRNVFHATRQFLLFPALLLVVLLIVNACGSTSEPLTIGVVNISPGLDVTLEGFKEGLAEAGFVEGEKVTYVYEGASGGIQGLGSAIAAVRAADVDLIFSITTPASVAVKRSIDGTDVPGVFAPVLDPVKSGLVESLGQPGGPIGLAWLVRPRSPRLPAVDGDVASSWNIPVPHRQYGLGSHGETRRRHCEGASCLLSVIAASRRRALTTERAR